MDYNKFNPQLPLSFENEPMTVKERITYLYSRLKKIGMERKVYVGYTLSLIIGTVIIIALFILGNYLQIFSIVVLLNILEQPYFFLRMRLPLYEKIAKGLADKEANSHERKRYYYLSKCFWKECFRVIRVWTAINNTVILFTVFILIFNAFTEGKNMAATIIFSLLPVFVPFFFVYAPFEYFCRESEEGEDLICF